MQRHVIYYFVDATGTTYTFYKIEKCRLLTDLYRLIYRRSIFPNGGLGHSSPVGFLMPIRTRNAPYFTGQGAVVAIFFVLLVLL